MSDEVVAELFYLFNAYTHMTDAVLLSLSQGEPHTAKRIISQHLNPVVIRVEELYNAYYTSEDFEEETRH